MNLEDKNDIKEKETNFKFHLKLITKTYLIFFKITL